jgi:chromosome segregation ATPase
VPAVVPGGKMAPDLFDRAPASKLAKLEEDARKLREAIEEKQAKKRQNLREWETLEREVNNNTLKADLAEQHLKSLNGENDVGGAAF